MHERRALDPTLVLGYLRGQLDQGRTLSSLLQRIDLAAGRFWTYLPPDPDGSATRHPPEQGGLTPPGGPTIALAGGGRFVPVVATGEPAIVELIGDFLRGGTDACCVLEDAMSRPGDPVIAGPDDIRYLFYGDEVYALLAGGDAGATSIDSAIRATRSYLLLAVLTLLPPGGDLAGPGGHVITFEDLRHFAEHAQTIVVRAYDGEGFLVWTRD
jgi:hypothetical protein